MPLWRGNNNQHGLPLADGGRLSLPTRSGRRRGIPRSVGPEGGRAKVTVLRALFNRSVIALAVWAASAAFHTLVDIEPHQLGTLIAAARAWRRESDYVVNFGVISVDCKLALLERTRIRVIRELRMGRLSEFVVSYLGLAVFGLILAKVFVDVSFFAVPVYVLPLLLARQMFFRSKALEEAHKELKDREHILRALSNRMAEERQDERLQIAAFLHDDLAQLLFRLSIQVDVTRKSLDAGQGRRSGAAARRDQGDEEQDVRSHPRADPRPAPVTAGASGPRRGDPELPRRDGS